MQDPLNVLDVMEVPKVGRRRLFSLPLLEARGFGSVSRLPVSIRIVLEALVRHLDGRHVQEEDVRALAAWSPRGPRRREVPLFLARVLLQDFTGVPLLVDLASMRSAARRLGADPRAIEPVIPVDLVVDHSIQVDAWGSQGAEAANRALEFQRNGQRYRFLRWGQEAFGRFRVVPPGAGICHQVNLEHLARGVFDQEGLLYPDTLVGTDSHTTMVNGLGVLGWGVGGIEAEAAMLGLPLGLLEPDVVALAFHGALREGVTATDLVLTVTERLRKAKVVGKFVEFIGPGAASLAAPTRATVANMAPEYGATLAFFPVDGMTLAYYGATGRPPEQVATVEAYHRAQGLFGSPDPKDVDYTEVLDLDLERVEPSVAGPRRPQDRIALGGLQAGFRAFLGAQAAPPDGEEGPVRQVQEGGPGTLPEQARTGAPAPPEPPALAHGAVVIAALTSCTNTSNPLVMLGAGLLARKARARGLKPRPWVKTSLAPGSRVVSAYLARTGLQADLDALGFNTVGYGCTTCIGNSGPLEGWVGDQVARDGLVVASVLSGNRNFEARIHPLVRANYLMSPPLVVAFALAGTVDIDLTREPLGLDRDGAPVHLADLWPTDAEVASLLAAATDPGDYRADGARILDGGPAWAGLEAPEGTLYAWEPGSTYIAEAPWFPGPGAPPAPPPEFEGARALAILGDSITTDHISPAGAIDPRSPAGRWLLDRGVPAADFNSYGSRRGHHEVMVRGTFANVRLRNLMVPGREGGFTVHQPSGEVLTIHEAALRYAREGVPLLVIAGQDYGTGSSRDWAAKGTRLLGVRAVVARSFERIHRSNLVGMGVLPLQFEAGTDAASLGLDGTETYRLACPGEGLQPGQRVFLQIGRGAGAPVEVPLLLRLDSAQEVECCRQGGILPWVLARLTGPSA